MISIENRVSTLVRLGSEISTRLTLYRSGTHSDFSELLVKARVLNPWFTEEYVVESLDNWTAVLNEESIRKWLDAYEVNSDNKRSGNIAVINAGNIPFVGLHDLLCVLMSGHNYIGKNASGDELLLPYLSDVLVGIEPEYKNRIRFVLQQKEMDAVIATGNNNSARYFEYYFGKYPHIIRKNRNGAGVLTGKESNEELHALGKDIFTYFGLGCRNVSKIYVPVKYDFNKLFSALHPYHEISMHNKYMNNFEYNNSIFLLKRIPFLQNGFLILREEKQIPSPISVLHFEYYSDLTKLAGEISSDIESYQCIVSSPGLFNGNETVSKINVNFGESQTPQLWDYADGVDTMKFLLKLQ